jgi:hypothetical protein
MNQYTITVIRKLGVNEFSDEEAVGSFDAEMIGPAKRAASEYIQNWLIDRKIQVRTRNDWVRDVKRGGLSRELLVTENGAMVKMIFVLREN